MMTKRHDLEEEIRQVSYLLAGFRPGGIDRTPTAQERTDLSRWLQELQSQRRQLLTPEEIAYEDSLPF